MTKEEIRLKAVENAKEYEVWPPVADYQDGLIKGFEDGVEWMLDNPTGGALLYAVEKAAERTKREIIEKAAEWMRNFKDGQGNFPLYDYVGNFKQAMEE